MKILLHKLNHTKYTSPYASMQLLSMCWYYLYNRWCSCFVVMHSFQCTWVRLIL